MPVPPYRWTSKLLDRTVTALAVLFAFAGTFFMVRPGGMLHEHVDGALEKRSAKKRVGEHWAEITEAPLRLDDSDDTVSIVVFADYGCGYCKMFQDSRPAA